MPSCTVIRTDHAVSRSQGLEDTYIQSVLVANAVCPYCKWSEGRCELISLCLAFLEIRCPELE